jgi:hypothetical protein
VNAPGVEPKPFYRTFGITLYVVCVLGIYVVMFARMPGLGETESELAAYAEQHFPNELARFENPPLTAGPRPNQITLPLGWTTELRVERGPTPVREPNTRPLRYSVHLVLSLLFLFSIVYFSAAGVGYYAIDVFRHSFTAEGYFFSTPGYDQPPLGPKKSWEVLTNDISNIQLFSRQLDRRSVLFLALGASTALVGVGYLLLVAPHDIRTGETTSQTALRLVRSLGLVAFIEAIAWFFLKQYRVLVEDSKSYYRMYLKRSNTLAALALASDQREGGTDLNASVVAALLADPVVERLAQGESTESLEAQRTPGGPVVGEIVGRIVPKDSSQ